VEWKPGPGGELLAHPSGVYQTQFAKDYLSNMMSWLQQNSGPMRIERWFAFSSHGWKEPWAAAPGGIALIERSAAAERLTAFGELYRAAANPVR